MHKIPICRVCEMPIPEAKPTRNRNVDLLDHCPLCQRKLRLCECEPPPQERQA